MDRISQILNEMLLHVAEAHHRDPARELTAFFPMVGDRYLPDRALMIVGRAVNGWTNSFKPADALDETRRLEIVRRASTSTAKDPSRPMSWVIDSWHPAEGYETVHSAFWRTIKKLVHAFRIPDADTDFWPDHLLWSDLYKISPEAGHNPSDPLCAIQEPKCIEMLFEEIMHWQPRRIVFLTGNNWADSFLTSLGATSTISKQGLIERVGRLRIPPVAEGIPYVVAPHPQGKPEDELVNEIVEAFVKL